MDIIVTLTDEQVEILRRRYLATPAEAFVALNKDLFTQLRDAAALYDRLTAEAEASHE